MSEQNPERTTLTINWAQIAGGALAAVTSAFLLAGLKSLGSYGTLVGAALGSVIASTAAAIYGYTLNRSRERLAEATRRARDRRTGPSPVPPAQDEHPDNAAPPLEDEGDPAPVPAPVPLPRKRFRPVHAVILGAVAFVLSVGGIFAWEQLSGESVAAVRQGSTSTVNPGIVGNEITSTPTTPTPTATATDSPTSTETGTGTPTEDPTGSATATDDPTSTSTATSTPSTSRSSSSSSSSSSATSGSTAQEDDALGTSTADSSDAALVEPTGTPTTAPDAG
jgi:hypothetical protein